MSQGMLAVLSHMPDLGDIPNSYNINQIDEFLKNDKTLVITEVEYINVFENYNFLNKVKHCNKVIVVSMDYRAWFIDMFKQFDLPNFHFVVNGNPKFSQAKLTHWWAYFAKQNYFYNHTPIREKSQWGKRMNKIKVRPYKFDCLYGNLDKESMIARPHKQFVYDWVQQHKQPNYFLESKPFEKRQSVNQKYANTHFQNEDDIFYEDHVEMSDTVQLQCKYYGQTMIVGQVLPLKVYEQSQYSLIFETDAHIFSPNEKLARVLLAKRLFVVIGCQHYLKSLKDIGLKTFDNVIDESYDNEPDDTKRWQMAMESALELCAKDPMWVLDQITKKVDYNQKFLGKVDASAFLKVFYDERDQLI